MNIDALISKLESYVASTVDDVEKSRYKVILLSIRDGKFIELLPYGTKELIKSINNEIQHFNDMDFVFIKDRFQTRIHDFENIYFFALSYLLDKNSDASQLLVEVNNVKKSIAQANSNLDNINTVSNLISGASILAKYAETYELESRSHADNAKYWLGLLYKSIGGFVILVTVLLFLNISEYLNVKVILAKDIVGLNNLNILLLTIKAALVFGYLQIPIFFKRNYFAEKHLEQASIHRRNVLKSLHAVYNTISEVSERDQIIKTGAVIAFSEPESGYITRKEGAGDSDLVETVLSRILNK